MNKRATRTILLLCLLPVFGICAQTPSDDFKVLNGEKRIILVIGASGSTNWPLRLQRKLIRYFNKGPENCPIQVVNTSSGNALFDSFVKVDKSGTSSEKTPKYLKALEPVFKNSAKTPVVVLAMNTTGAFLPKYGGHPLSGPNDEANIVWDTIRIRAVAETCAKDGAVHQFYSNYYYHGKGAKADHHKYEAICMQRIEANLKGFHAVSGLTEGMLAGGDLVFASKSDTHPGQIGDEIMASAFLSFILKHDGQKVPEWVNEEVEFMKKVPAGSRQRIKGGDHSDLDKNKNGLLEPTEYKTAKEQPYTVPWRPDGKPPAIVAPMGVVKETKGEDD